MSAVSFALPGMRLVNPTNEHTHWRTRATRAKAQRHAGRAVTASAIGRIDFAHCVVTITRLSTRLLDSDSLPPSAKHLRDGIADALGVDDGDARYEWRYEQRKAKGFGVEVSIVWEPTHYARGASKKGGT